MNIKTYFSPDENTQQVFLDFINSTQSQLRIAIYGLHLPPLIESLKRLHKEGKDVAIVCDHLQARGHYERPEIIELLESGIKLVEGTSEKHKIMHHKFAVVDQAKVLSGSWNFSLSASEESNYFDIIEDKDRAKMFLGKWQEMWDWINAHEQKYQEKLNK